MHGAITVARQPYALALTAIEFNRVTQYPNAGILGVHNVIGIFIDIIARGNAIDPDFCRSAKPVQPVAALRDTPWPDFLFVP